MFVEGGGGASGGTGLGEEGGSGEEKARFQLRPLEDHVNPATRTVRVPVYLLIRPETRLQSLLPPPRHTPLPNHSPKKNKDTKRAPSPPVLMAIQRPADWSAGTTLRAQAEQSRAGQCRAEPSNAELSREMPSSAGQSRAEASRAGRSEGKDYQYILFSEGKTLGPQSRAEPCRAEQSRVDLGEMRVRH